MRLKYNLNLKESLPTTSHVVCWCGEVAWYGGVVVA